MYFGGRSDGSLSSPMVMYLWRSDDGAGYCWYETSTRYKLTILIKLSTVRWSKKTDQSQKSKVSIQEACRIDEGQKVRRLEGW